MKYVKRTALGLLGVVGLLLVWGVAIEPRIIDREDVVAHVPALPPAWDGQQVALIADFQVDMWLANTDTVRRIVEGLARERPAAVLIAGDFIYKADPDPGPEIAAVIDLLRPLPVAGIPTLAVLGNHDYSINWRDDPKDEAMATRLQQALEAAGVDVLHNEAVVLPTPAPGGTPGATPLPGSGNGPPLYVVGVGARWAGEDRPAAAVAQVPEGTARLVLMHHPDSFAALPPRTAPLAMAGHTHGGQIRVPFTPEWSWLSLTTDDAVHVDGWIQGFGQPGNRLYVNRGIGFSSVPIRLFCPPEVTVFTLRAGQP